MCWRSRADTMPHSAGYRVIGSAVAGGAIARRKTASGAQPCRVGDRWEPSRQGQIQQGRWDSGSRRGRFRWVDSKVQEVGGRWKGMEVRADASTEAARLEAVDRCGLLDSGVEERFDRLVGLAATMLEAPIALISAVGAERQWFKATVGLDLAGTAREISFCHWALEETEPGPFVVCDTHHDRRFSDNPLVTGELGIRFYAGQVIRDRDGHGLGTLCVLDRAPRTLSDSQRRTLVQLAALVEDEVQRRDELAVLIELDRSERRQALIVATIDEGLVFHDTTGRIVEWNPAAERVLGLSGDQLAGRGPLDPRWRTTRADGTVWEGSTHPAMIALTTGRAVRGEVMGVHRPDGTRVWLRVNAQPVIDGGVVRGALAVFTDITAEHLEANMLIATLDAAPVGLAIVDATGHVARANPTFAKHVGRDIAALAGLDPATVFRPVDPTTIDTVDPVGRTDGADRRIECRVTRPDGSEITVAFRAGPAPSPDGFTVVATMDITDVHRDRLLLDAVLDTAPVGIAILDEDRRILRCNATYAAQTGRTARELEGIDPSTLLHPDDRDAAVARRRSLTSGHPSDPPMDVRLVRPDGTEITVTIHTTLLTTPAPIVVAASIDITERERLTRTLEHQATHDALTGLANRARFETELVRVLARSERDHHRFAICYLDLDRFKDINDTYGHAGGDAVLAALGTRLTAAIRAGDLAARLGGDEFAVLLDPVADLDDSYTIAARIHDAITAGDPPVGVSIGLTLNIPDDTPKGILTRADQAQYNAKTSSNTTIHPHPTDDGQERNR